MVIENQSLEKSPLGKPARYETTHYDPTLLFPIARAAKRESIGITDSLPFFGFDIWNHYEVSWLNTKGKPIVAVAEIIYSCDSSNIIESKSMKLYFNSFNQTQFENVSALEKIIQNDLSKQLRGSFLSVNIIPLTSMNNEKIYARFDGFYLDELDIDCAVYENDPDFLTTNDVVVEETLCSDLLKSNCLITNQPDWYSIKIHYKGKKINREGLLRYIISFRNTNAFHEHGIEKIFMHLMQYCKPLELAVYGRSTRRGGIDINAYRATQPIDPRQIQNNRLCRQ